MSATTLDKFNEVAKMSLGRITLSRTENEFQTHAVHDIIVNHHSYVPTTSYVGRKIDYLIENDGTLIGTIGIGSANLSMGTRDRFIGWDAEQRMKHLVNMCNNYRFTLMPNAPHLAGSRILSELERHIVKDWQEPSGELDSGRRDQGSAIQVDQEDRTQGVEGQGLEEGTGRVQCRVPGQDQDLDARRDCQETHLREATEQGLETISFR